MARLTSCRVTGVLATSPPSLRANLQHRFGMISTPIELRVQALRKPKGYSESRPRPEALLGGLYAHRALEKGKSTVENDAAKKFTSIQSISAPDRNAILGVLRTAEGSALIDHAADRDEAVPQQPDEPPGVDATVEHVVHPDVVDAVEPYPRRILQAGKVSSGASAGFITPALCKMRRHCLLQLMRAADTA